MKSYKKQIIVVSNLFMFLLIAFSASQAIAQKKSAVDISIRPALYFGKSVLNTQPITKDSRYVAAGKKIVLTPADATNSSNGNYTFTIMYIIYGSPSQDVLGLEEFTNRLRVGDSLLNQHTIKFAATDSIANQTRMQYVRTTIILPIGESVIRLSLDDDKKISESNENNNYHTFTVEVNAKP